MDGTNIPGSTLRVLASLLVVAFDVAREKAVDVIARVKPLVEPPDDLRVTSRVGALYSGIVVLDRSEVIAGIVVQTGQTLPSAALITPPPTFGSRTSSSAEARTSQQLPSWADDPRTHYDDEESPWRRR
jgi:hypothetical protein